MQLSTIILSLASLFVPALAVGDPEPNAFGAPLFPRQYTTVATLTTTRRTTVPLTTAPTTRPATTTRIATIATTTPRYPTTTPRVVGTGAGAPAGNATVRGATGTGSAVRPTATGTARISTAGAPGLGAGWDVLGWVTAGMIGMAAALM